MPGSYTPPQDTSTVKYSRYDRFKAAVTAVADALADPAIEPQQTDQFKDLEERFWAGIVEVTLLAAAGGGGGSGGTSGYLPPAANLTAMRAVTSKSTNQVCVLLGEVSAYDGGGGFYAWEIDPTSAAVDAPMTDIVPNDRASVSTGNKGYWKKFA
jgi:hypothetical protein